MVVGLTYLTFTHFFLTIFYPPHNCLITDNEAPTNEGVDGLHHFEKTILFKENYAKEHPQMKGWTVCGILKIYSF